MTSKSRRRGSSAEIGATGSVKKLDDEQRIPDFVGDFGGQHAEGGEGFIFSQRFLGLKNAGIKPGVLQGDRGKTRERGQQRVFRHR